MQTNAADKSAHASFLPIKLKFALTQLKPEKYWAHGENVGHYKFCLLLPKIHIVGKASSYSKPQCSTSDEQEVYMAIALCIVELIP